MLLMSLNYIIRLFERGAKGKILKNENSVGLGDKHITPSIKVHSDSRTKIHRLLLVVRFGGENMSKIQ